MEQLLSLGVTPPGAEPEAPEAPEAAPEVPAATPTVADLVSRYEQAVGGYTPLWEREGGPDRTTEPAPAAERAEEEEEEEHQRRRERKAFERGRESGRWQAVMSTQLQALGDKWEGYKQSPIRRHTPGRPALTPRPTPNDNETRAGARSLRRAASVKSAQKLTFGTAAARRERPLSVSPAIRKKKGGGGGSTPRAKLAEQRHRARLARQPRF